MLKIRIILMMTIITCGTADYNDAVAIDRDGGGHDHGHSGGHDHGHSGGSGHGGGHSSHGGGHSSHGGGHSSSGGYSSGGAHGHLSSYSQPDYGHQGTIYYQQPANNGGGKDPGKALAATAGLAGLAGLGALGLLAANPTLLTNLATALGIGRKKRSVNDEYSHNNSTQERQTFTLLSLLDQSGLESISILQKDMIASYLQCSDKDESKTSLVSCVEKLACIHNDRSLKTTKSEEEIISMILNSLLENTFLNADFKMRIEAASEMGHTRPGLCDQFICQHDLFQGPPPAFSEINE